MAAKAFRTVKVREVTSATTTKMTSLAIARNRSLQRSTSWNARPRSHALSGKSNHWSISKAWVASQLGQQKKQYDNDHHLKWNRRPKLVTNLCLYRPASSEIPDIIKLFDAGMTLARFNLSHGTTKVSKKELKRVKLLFYICRRTTDLLSGTSRPNAFVPTRLAP